MPVGLPTLAPTLRGYQRGWIRYDVLAGVAAGTVVIPQAMAYATIAGLPVEVGLYTCMLPMIAYALLGGSHSLSISTTSTIAILTAGVLAGLPEGRSTDDLLRAAFTLTALVGLWLLVMRLFRLGSVVEQISPATMVGVKAGVGLTVAASQLPTLLGVAGDPEEEGFFGRIGDVLTKLDDVSGTTLAVSAVAIALLYLLRRVAPQVPGPLVVSAAAILLVALSDVEDHGLALIPSVPSGLPTPTMPVWGDITTLLPGAFAIALMAFMETVVVARAQREQSEEPIDADRELLANGVAALVGGLSQSMPPAGGFSQSAVNQRAGARSQLAGITTAVLAVLVALFLGPVLDDLPEAILAAMVFVAVVGLVSFRAFVELYRVHQMEFWVALATAVLGLTVGLLDAVLIGVVLTLVLVIREVSSSRAQPLTGVDVPADVLALRLVSGLYTGNARPTQDAILAAALERDPRPATVLLECSQVSMVTTPFIETITALATDLRREGIALVVIGLPEPSLAAARRAHAFAAFSDAGGTAPSLEEALP